jgi:hypothetical protein
MFRAPLCPSSGVREYYTGGTTGSNHHYNTLELLMMGIVVPETCWVSNKICNKNRLLHLVDILFPHINDDARSKSHQTVLVDLLSETLVFVIWEHYFIWQLPIGTRYGVSKIFIRKLQVLRPVDALNCLWEPLILGSSVLSQKMGFFNKSPSVFQNSQRSCIRLFVVWWWSGLWRL